MNNSDKSGCLGVIVIIIFVGAWVLAGIKAWDWIEPKSFWGAIKFLILWGLAGYVNQMIAALIIGVVASILEKEY